MGKDSNRQPVNLRRIIGVALLLWLCFDAGSTYTADFSVTSYKVQGVSHINKLHNII